jgi:hypothetical protein
LPKYTDSATGPSIGIKLERINKKEQKAPIIALRRIGLKALLNFEFLIFILFGGETIYERSIY